MLPSSRFLFFVCGISMKMGISILWYLTTNSLIITSSHLSGSQSSAWRMKTHRVIRCTNLKKTRDHFQFMAIIPEIWIICTIGKFLGIRNHQNIISAPSILLIKGQEFKLDGKSINTWTQKVTWGELLRQNFISLKMCDCQHYVFLNKSIV
jgi:hypothetical protein